MRGINHIIIFIFISFKINAQVSICNLTNDDILSNTIKCLGINSNNKKFSDDVLKKITDEIGISYNFTFINCPNSQNAAAIINPIQNNKRFIIFDSKYFKEIYKADEFSFYFILAHEIGHHINGHTIPKEKLSIYEQQQQELESDYFAGFILYRLGASENDIIRTINLLPEPQSNNETHPKNAIRLQFALNGFKNEEAKSKDELYKLKAKIIKQKEIEYINNVNKIEQRISAKISMDKYDELISSLQNYRDTKLHKHLNIAEYLLSQLDKKNSIIKGIEAYINFEKGDYILAFEYYKNQYLISKKTEDLAIFFEIISKTNLKSKEITSIIDEINNSSKDPSKLLELGIYYMQVGEELKGKNIFHKAYEIIKNEEDCLLKSDIYMFYARILYDEEIKLNNYSFQISEKLFLQSKNIIEKYPNDLLYRKYYNSILFHLASINYLKNNNFKAIEYYNELLVLEKNRIDYICKSISALASIYNKEGNYEKENEYLSLFKEKCN